MQIDTTSYPLVRDPNTTDYTDLITSGAVRSGDAFWDERQVVVTIPFTPEPTAAEQWAITRRLITANAEEESLYIQAESAVGANTDWRTNTSPQVETGANTIINDASITSSEVPVYLRDVARGVRTLNTQVAALSAQNNAIIKLVLKQMITG